jgi:hypothetical protein
MKFQVNGQPSTALEFHILPHAHTAHERLPQKAEELDGTVQCVATRYMDNDLFWFRFLETIRLETLSTHWTKFHLLHTSNQRSCPLDEHF